MKIETASVALASQHSEVSHQRVQEQLRVWNGNHRLELTRDSSRTSASSMVTHLSALAQAMPRAAPAPTSAPAAEALPATDTEAVDPKLEPLIRLVELITGRKVRLFRAEDLNAKAAPQGTPNPTATPAAQRAGWGLSYDRTETRYEAEHTQVQVEGTVKTSDGREIRFALSLEMRREYLETSSVSLRAGDALLKDPLAIHFDGPAGELSDLRFDFDLDADGRLDNMAFVGAGSGFLVLDKNGNGWIDENDRAFDQLQVWQKDAQGQDRLRTLREANVGALYLGRVASPFSVRDATNQTLAEVRSTGVYLREDGGAGALQQIDLAV